MIESVIDVLICVCNGAKTIRASIESIQNQTIRDIRIIIVDDGSTDETVAILNDIARLDPRLHIIKKSHSGIVDSLNLGLAECRAEFIARFDADDISYPHRFASQLEFLRENPRCMAVASRAIHIDEYDQPLGTITNFRPIEQADPAWVPSREPYLLQPFLMIRKSSLDAVGGYRYCDLAEDSDLFWRLREVGELRNVNDILGAYRMNPHSISSKSIVNGRRLALCSQLIGISALRRYKGTPDIVFGLDRIDAYSKAIELEEFCRLGSKGLDDEELLRLRVASSIKLLEFTFYRPYELALSDCQFIRESLIEGGALINKENRKEINSRLIDAFIRLFNKGMLREAFALSSSNILFRVLYRLALPDQLRNYFKLIIKKSNY